MWHYRWQHHVSERLWLFTCRVDWKYIWTFGCVPRIGVFGGEGGSGGEAHIISGLMRQRGYLSRPFQDWFTVKYYYTGPLVKRLLGRCHRSPTIPVLGHPKLALQNDIHCPHIIHSYAFQIKEMSPIDKWKTLAVPLTFVHIGRFSTFLYATQAFRVSRGVVLPFSRSRH